MQPEQYKKYYQPIFDNLCRMFLSEDREYLEKFLNRSLTHDKEEGLIESYSIRWKSHENYIFVDVIVKGTSLRFECGGTQNDFLYRDGCYIDDGTPFEFASETS